LEDWAAERHWYEWSRKAEKPLCLYSLSRLARSDPERPAIGRGHVDRARAILKTYILPDFGKFHLNDIAPEALERWLFSLSEKGLASKTVNNIGSAFRTMTAEAYRLNLIQDDPWKRVPMFAPNSKPRDVLTIAEALKLMNPETTERVWNGNAVNYLMNLTAMVTARRSGELLALTRADLFPNHLTVTRSWSIRYHTTGPTKTKVKAPIPIPSYLYERLRDFTQWDGYIFSYTGGKSPATAARVADALYAALDRIGIDDAERRRRNIVFHSWRLFSNTYLRTRGIPDAKIRALTLHKTEEMTEHYTAFHAEDFQDVIAEQDLLARALTDADAARELIKGRG
jgi:integrase